MLTLTKNETNPCSGGWPNLNVKEWNIEGHPSLFVHLSFYSGTNVEPSYCLSIKNKKNGTINPFTKKLPSFEELEGMTKFSHLNDYEIEDFVAKALALSETETKEEPCEHEMLPSSGVCKHCGMTAYDAAGMDA